MNLPDYQFLSAPLWMITVLQILVVTLHFVAMNLLVGGICFVIFSHVMNKQNLPVVGLFIKIAPVAMAGTVTLGVAALLFLQVVYPHQFYAATIVSGWFWLLVVGAAIMGYYLLYAAAFGFAGNSKRKMLLLCLALACFFYISFIYSATFSLAERPDLYRELFHQVQSGWILNPDWPHYLFRWLHMLTGAMMVGGYWMGWLGRKDQAGFTLAKWFTLGGLILASLFGMIYLVILGPVIPALMRTPASWVLALSILLSLGALHFFFKRMFVASGLMLFLSMAGMVLIRHYLRLILLRETYDPAMVRLAPQWSIFLIFLGSFLLAAGLLVYMLKLFFAPQQTEKSWPERL
jgi:hypothetical protein